MKLLIVFVSILFLMSGCGNNPDEKVFKVGTNIWPGYEALYLAKEEQLYSENIQVNTYDSATIVLSKFRKKEIDAAALTLDEVILLQDQGYNPIVIAVLDISNGADVLIAKKSIKSLSDLKNKSIGVENTALGSYVL
ncbi:MAG: ABC transporter substrate-binding protein, partial [Sulfurimonas sp.]|nr:ABC transporter substrate-binding protein [Sulfurimonas sp.]